jgi:ribonuclease D
MASIYPVTRSVKHIRVYHDDLGQDVVFTNSVAIDTETMGLVHRRDRLCVVQMSEGNGTCHLVKFSNPIRSAPNLVKILENKAIEKVFHFARFDLGSLYAGLGVMCQGPIYCTKIASKLVRTYTDHHGLRALCRELLSVDISKTEQSSDWGHDELTDAQKNYAASDVLHLHALKARLDHLLRREGRYDLFQSICRFLPTRVHLDLMGFDADIFCH